MSSNDELTTLLNKEEYNFIYECGFNKFISIDNKDEFVKCAILHFVIFNVCTELCSLRKGLLETLQLSKLPPEVLKALLCSLPSSPDTVTAMKLFNLLLPCDSGDIKDERTVTFLKSYICECEGWFNF